MRRGYVIEEIDVIDDPTDVICNVEIITDETDGNDDARGRDSEIPDEIFAIAALDRIIRGDGAERHQRLI